VKPSSCTKNLGFSPTWPTNCQRFRFEQSTGIPTPMVYLFGEEKSRAKNSMVAHKHMEHKEHREFILVQASRE
jgi:hypothetical protein